MTIKDVAARAGVSPATVSNVLNGTKFVSEERKARVLEAVRELDYQVDYIASSMKRKQTHTIGVMLTALNLLFTNHLINGIQSVISSNDYRLIFYTSDNNIEREARYLRMLVTSRVDGIILNTVASEKRNLDYLRRLARLHSGGKDIPLVSVERNLEKFGVTSVHVDNVHGGEMATGHLLACGCRRIALITGPTFSDLVLDRVTGYKNALAGAGIPYDEHLVYKGDFTPLSGVRAVHHLLRENIDFDGIFACNDEMALGAMKALTDHGKRVPEDVKLMGFDNTFVSSLVSPQISTVNVPKYRIGSTAAHILMDLMRDEEAAHPLSCKMPIALVERGSTVQGKLTDWELDAW